jgi:hypothetical protein
MAKKASHRGRPRGTRRFERQVTVFLTRETLDLVEERKTRETTTFSEALRRCLEDHLAAIRPMEGDRILVAISRQDKEDLRRLVVNGLVSSEDYAATAAIHKYISDAISERKERQKALGTV